MGNVYNILADILKKKVVTEDILLFKGKDDLSFLKDWLSREEDTSSVVVEGNLSIDEIIEGCAKCNDISERKIPIGTGINGVMIILNAPGFVSNIEKRLYKKDSIDLLKKIIKAIKIDFNKCYITNLIKCETDDPLTKQSEMVKRCDYIIKKEIELIKPSIVIVMGVLLPLQKIIHESKGISWFSIDHPITLLKNPDLKRKAWGTLKVVMEKISKIKDR